MILEHLSLPHAAAAAWQRYLSVDTSSVWNLEARSRLQALYETGGDRSSALTGAAFDWREPGATRRLVRKDAEAARTLVEEHLLARWGRATIEGSFDSASEALGRAHALAAALAELHGDYLARDAVQAIEQAPAARRVELAQGHHLFGVALELLEQDRYSDAIPLLRKSNEKLAVARSPFHRWAVLHLAVCEYYGHRIDEMMRLLELERHLGGAQRYPILRARNLWLTGLAHLQRAELPQALMAYEAALRLFERGNEKSHAGFLYSLLAGSLHYFGDAAGSWRHHARALSSLPLQANPRRRYSILWSAAQAAQENPLVAERLLDELIAALDVSTSPAVRSEALCRRASLQLELGRPHRAASDLRGARGILAAVPDLTLRRRIEADLLVLEGRIARREDPVRAVVKLDAALARFSEADYAVEVADLRLEKADALLEAGNVDLAEAELATSIRSYRDYRQLIQVLERQATYWSLARSAVEAMVRLQLDKRHEPFAAFEYVELDWRGNRSQPKIHGSAARRAASKEIIRQLPEAAFLISTFVLEDRLVLWGLGRRGQRTVQLFVPRRDLESLIEAHRKELRTPESPVTASARLWQLLIGPFADWLRVDTSIVLVPDGPLYTISLPALVNSKRRRYLIEDHSVVSAPSARAYLEALRHLRQMSQPPKSLLFVEAGQTTPSSLPRLAPLRPLDIDYLHLTRHYLLSSSLRGGMATPLRVLEGLRDVDVAQVNAHGLSGRSSASGVMLYASDPKDPASGLWTARHLGDLDFKRLRLVILAGCRTAGDSQLPDILSLPSALLASNVPSVLVSQWELNDDDRCGQSLLQHFHSLLVHGEAPSKALRSAQVVSLRAPKRCPTREWAVYNLFGAG
ncbi:MAG TPA: CHAT domain-containing protein [Thermoanaerobaculia bacterium]|nr:CHAT domain-containing protein [Thermoanaerobaculia bacterium]